jgi:hypothetical protein
MAAHDVQDALIDAEIVALNNRGHRRFWATRLSPLGPRSNTIDPASFVHYGQRFKSTRNSPETANTAATPVSLDVEI